MTLAVSPLCTDEDILAEAGEDLAYILPRSQILASGSDGALTAANPWDLVSATCPFEDRGVTSGRIAILAGTAQTAAVALFGTSGQFFIADEISGSTLTLRRPNLAGGVGQPPGPNTGAVDSVRFRVHYLDPQILAASRWILLKLGSGAQNDYDAATRKQICIWEVLSRLYQDEWRSSENEVYAVKARLYAQRASMLMSGQGVNRGGVRSGTIQSVAEISPYPPTWLRRYGW